MYCELSGHMSELLKGEIQERLLEIELLLQNRCFAIVNESIFHKPESMYVSLTS